MRWASARVPESPGERPGGSSTPVLVAAGFALGAMAGWLLGEWSGGISRSRVGSLVRRLQRERPAPGAPVIPRDRIKAALDADPELQRLGITLMPAGKAAIELHGWVPSRRVRAHASRVATAAAGDLRLVDCLLVRGEDDRPPAGDGAGASQSA